MSGTLWLVGTPIGNLADLAPRAREVLDAADVVAAEDTRRTGRLLRGLGLSKRMVSLHDANEAERVGPLLSSLRDGETIAVVSDAGMPLVSDPGYRLVRACIDAGIPVEVVPGPSAILAALVLSGLPTDRFVFEGFPPRKPGARAERLAALRDDPRTIVFFEAPGRVRRLLREVVDVLGDRPSALCRELTKLHEETVRGRASEILAVLADDPKGEVVLVVGGATGPPTPDVAASVEEARTLVADGMKKRDAARVVADRHGASANEVYAALVEHP